MWLTVTLHGTMCGPLRATQAEVKCGMKGGGRVRVASVVYHGWYGANALWHHMIDDTTISYTT